MAVILVKRLASRPKLSTLVLCFFYFFLRCILCDVSDENTYLHTIIIGKQAVLDCAYNGSLTRQREWLYNNNVTLFKNKLKVQEPFANSATLLTNYSLLFTNLSLEHQGLYQCIEETQTLFDYFLFVEVLPEVNISISHMSDATIIPTNRYIEVTCLARGSKPAVNLTWLLNNDEVDPKSKQDHNISVNSANNKTFDTVAILTFRPQSSPLNITCVVNGLRRKEYHSTVYNAEYEKLKRFMIGLGISILMVISCALGFLIRRSYSVGSATFKNVTSSDDKGVSSNRFSSSRPYQDLIRRDVDPFDGTFDRTNDKDEGTSIEDDTVSLEKLHGGGMVTYWKKKTSFKNTKNIHLRKCLSENFTLDDQLRYRDLAIRLISMPKHRNIVETIKITTKVPYCIYQEYIDIGNLHEYLRNNLRASTVYDSGARNEAEEIQAKLSKYVLDIVDAMVFLTKEKLHHPALSARKVLLDNLHRCKLYDLWPQSLCIARIQHIIQKTNPPVAWLAPETSSSLQYSDKSDVWSFATLLWEMYSIGDIPYEDMTSMDINLDIRRSMYLNQPYFCPRNMYDIMLDSWRMSPEERPSFDLIRKVLNNTKEFKDETAYADAPSAYCVLSDDIQENNNG